MRARRLVASALALSLVHIAARPQRPRLASRLRDPLALALRRTPTRRRRSARTPTVDGPTVEQQICAFDRARNDFLRHADHELRSPLTIVLGYTEMLLAGDVGPLGDEQSAMLAKVEDSGTELLRRIEDLLVGAGRWAHADATSVAPWGDAPAREGDA